MKNNRPIRPGVIIFLVLAISIGAGLNWMTQWSQSRVAENQEAAMIEFIQHMLPQSTPNITMQSFELLAPNYLKMGDIQTATRIYDNDRPVQVIYRALSTKAYHDRIGVMAAFNEQCTITHVEIISHKETPGLGDQFKLNDNAWLKSLSGKTINTQWALKPQGDIDTWTGATVTPQAIVETLQRMQSLCAEQQALLFSEEEILYLEMGQPEINQP